MGIKSYLEYLETCKDNKEIYRFDTQEDATYFGKKLKENLCKELECGEFELSEFIEVKISSKTVRIYKTEVCELLEQGN